MRSVYRRLRWRAHWRVRAHDHFHVADWTHGMSIDLPRSGSAAQVYYREFSSPVLARTMIELLAPGMTMIDVGAHVGEYALLGARLVGNGGRVVAVEPQPQLAKVIRHNADLNGLRNLEVRTAAVGDRNGTTGFEVDDGSGGGWTLSSRDGATPCATLDTLVATAGGHVDFLKLDAAGNEPAVLDGGQRSLRCRSTPRIAYKLYHPRVATERFGTDSRRAVDLLSEFGYDQTILAGAMAPLCKGDDAIAALGTDWYSVPVLATCRPRPGPT
jgi:FkbM family methyltransferase